jgi:hypothetical protein
MLNPVVLSLPLALAILFALAVAAWAYRRWLEAAAPWAPPAPGRHRMTRAAIAAERINEAERRPTLIVIPGVADWRQPLTDFERQAGVIETAGHDDARDLTAVR